MTLLTNLKQWRGEMSRKKGVEVFRILPNRTLEEIAMKLPDTTEALLEIHGIGEKKIQEYGETILQIVSTYNPQPTTHDGERKTENEKQRRENGDMVDSSDATRYTLYDVQEDVSQQVVSVGEFLDRTNAVLMEMPASVKGEVSSADIRERYVFFTIKDSEDNASLSIFMWRNQYDLCGVRTEVGVEVVVRGRLDIYKPSGRLSFRADSMELVGEGAIKAAYDRLRNQLEAEGLFAPERKRPLPEFPHRIGLITSKEGAVIHDFMSNIGKFGFHISFVNSRVEGALAVTELLRAMRTLRTYPIDALVIIRGGGSLESLSAFNNEALVREIADFPVPVICGIGHDKDVPLASLTADKMVSTPTAVTRDLNSSWERLVSRVDILERDLLSTFERELTDKKNTFHRNVQNIFSSFSEIVQRCRGVEEHMRRCTTSLGHALEVTRGRIVERSQWLTEQFGLSIAKAREKIRSGERLIVQSDPRRQLKLGYSIATSGGRIVRLVGDVKAGDAMNVLVSDGEVRATVQSASLKRGQ